MASEPINPNKEATPDPRIETQRQQGQETVLTYDDDTLPVDSDHEGVITSDGDSTRPVPTLQPDGEPISNEIIGTNGIPLVEDPKNDED